MINPFLKEEVVRIALTGGPCGGKTTILAGVRQWLEDFGHVVVVVREAATEFIHDGLAPWRKWKSEEEFEKNILHAILEKEELYARAALDIFSDKPRILICDRGTLDARAYLNEKQFLEVMARERFELSEFLNRYSLAVHLVTAADGAEAYYVNTPERKETLAEARALDERTKIAWLGTSHLAIIGNETDLSGKEKRAKAAIARVLGIPVPIEEERKFLIDNPDFSRFPTPVQLVDIRQVYLKIDPPEERRVRQRGIGGRFSCYYTIKKPFPGGGGRRSEQEREISAEEYDQLLGEADPNSLPIVKRRHTFIFGGLYFELDEFDPAFREGWNHDQCLLEVELTEESRKVVTPPFLRVIREVTDDPYYSNREIARRLRR